MSHKKIIQGFCRQLLFLLIFTGALRAQTGPNSPNTRANDASIGTNAWANPNQIINSNNGYATVATKGITNYLSGTNYGFAIVAPAAVDGIVLEVERSTTASTAVAVLDNWTTGMTKVISAGVARCLVVAVVGENGLGSRDVTNVTYGGQALTQISQVFVGAVGGFCGRIEYWRLMETGIAAAVGTNFVVTFDGTALQENWETVSSAVYQFVDQTIPVFDTRTFTSNNATNPITLSPALSTRTGGMSISGVFCGNNTTPASSVGGTNTYAINSAFTEVIDTYSANSGFTGSGGSYQFAHKAAATTGSEGPAYTFAGTVNRQVASCIHLSSIREVDHSVRLLKAGAVTGSDYAQTTSFWPTTDAYATYGGASDLWGTTWTTAEVNAANFGAVLSASVQNGTAQVDHMRITIYSHSTLPIELTDFMAQVRSNLNYLRWRTISERNNKEFIIERAPDGVNFRPIGTVSGKGNSRVINDYEFTDQELSQGHTYYRLKQVDTDGSFSYSKIIVITAPGSQQETIIYPNPSTGLFNITSAQMLSEGAAIYTAEMKLVKVLTAAPGDLRFSLEDMADGVYYLIYTEHGKQKVRRLNKSCSGW